MKKHILTLFIILLTATIATAQNMNRQKIKLLKTSFITDAINLTPSEAEKFWPVYNLHTTKIQKLKFLLEGGIQRDIRLAGGLENLSNSEAQKFVDDVILLEQQIAQNKVKLIQDLNAIISPKKMLRLQKAERDFNRRILQEYGRRKRMQNKQN